MAIIEVYACDECGVHADQGPDDGLPDGWAVNVEDMAFCAECLIRSPLDAHECDNDMCCYGATTPRTPDVVIS
jgi:hypothetical protein